MDKGIKNPNLIVKNGLLLASRFFLSLLLSFYTARLTLKVLGDIDFGINNIIGGLIAMFAVVSMPITNSLQRFFNVEFAKQKTDEGIVFNTALRLIIFMVAGMIFLYETVGLYVLGHVLEFPDNRFLTVEIVYQITALITAISLLIIPFSALLYSKEMMGIPAGIELFMNISKLLVLLAIPFVDGDKLILFTTSMLLIFLAQLIAYVVICNHRCKIMLTGTYDGKLLREMLGFSGWNSIESIAGISITYLSNIFINIFGGVLYNTANGLSKSISSAVSTFSVCVVKSIEPQITSASVLGEEKYRDALVMLSVKIAFCCISFAYVCFFFDGETFLELWLEKVPKYVFVFCRVMLFSCIFTSVVLPLRSVIIASGKIHTYFTIYGLLSFFSLVVMFVLLKMGWPIVSVLYVSVACSFLNLLNAIVTTSKITSMKIVVFGNQLFRVIVVSLLTFGAYHFLSQFAYHSFVMIFVKIIWGSILMIFFFLFVGLNKTEQAMLMKKIKMLVKKE